MNKKEIFYLLKDLKEEKFDHIVEELNCLEQTIREDIKMFMPIMKNHIFMCFECTSDV